MLTFHLNDKTYLGIRKAYGLDQTRDELGGAPKLDQGEVILCSRAKSEECVNLGSFDVATNLVLLALDIFVVNDDLGWLESGEEVG